MLVYNLWFSFILVSLNYSRKIRANEDALDHFSFFFFFFSKTLRRRDGSVTWNHRFAIAREELPCRFERSLAWLACERSGRAWEVGYL